MTHDDFDDLDRMLAALPLEEPPAGLRSRVLSATVYQPRPVVSTWEVWLVGTLVALSVWVAWMVAGSPQAGERLVDATSRLIEAGGLTSISTVLWLAVGASAAWWMSLMSFPAGVRRIEVR
ncbi:MAG: hypothetical protein NVS3B7_14500 [Candidatus Elarobacter sp.]